MDEEFFYTESGERKGPVGQQALQRMLAEGRIARDAPVFRGAATVPVTAQEAAAIPPQPAPPAPGLLRAIGSKLSRLAGVPDAADVPVGQLIVGDGDGAGPPGPVEDVFAVGTSTTTPAVASIAGGWPRPRVFWRVLVGALLAYLMLRVGFTEFGNSKFVPGLLVVGAFGVPLAVVVFFFEMNTPRNVSIYQVAKMMLLGGAASLIATVVLGEIVPGAGVGKLIPALLTGVVEESGKVLALLLIARAVRFPWQVNGMLFGAAVGAGFSGFESAGYAAQSSSMFSNIMWRALLAPGGHVIWTAMIGAAIWQVRGSKPFRMAMLLDRTVVHRWAVAVVLHGLWDTVPFPQAEILFDCLLLLAGWYLTFAVFKLALAEVATARASAIAAAAPPAPSAP